jgi:hypothetical protein
MAMYGGFMLEVMRKGGLFNWEEIKHDFIPL